MDLFCRTNQISKKEKAMKKNVLVFGSLSGLVIAVCMIISSTLCYNNPNYEGSMIVGYASMLLAMCFVFVGIKNFRDKYNNGVITFGKAFMTGFYIALISSTVYVLIWLVEYYVFMPDFMEKYMQHVLEQAKASGMGEAEYNKQVQEMSTYADMYKSPVGVILLTYMEVLPVGLLVTLISALILKKKPKAVTQ